MEAETLALQCVTSAGKALILYGGLILGLEIGGLISGYPGRGREIHENLMKQLKQMFTGKNNRPRK